MLFHLITTSAPLLVSELEQLTEAKFFSNKVLPMNSPRPNPFFSLSKTLVDLKYGSPIFDNMSLGYPSPSVSYTHLRAHET